MISHRCLFGSESHINCNLDMNSETSLFGGLYTVIIYIGHVYGILICRVNISASQSEKVKVPSDIFLKSRFMSV